MSTRGPRQRPPAAGHGIGASLASVLGGVALGLAIVGVFGIFGCYVEERRHEIGIRIALGAPTARVVALLFQTARRALVPGVVGGTFLGLAAGFTLRSFLCGLSLLDPWSYLEVAAILAFSAALATWVPALRAVRIDPVVTLRSE